MSYYSRLSTKCGPAAILLHRGCHAAVRSPKLSMLYTSPALLSVDDSSCAQVYTCGMVKELCRSAFSRDMSIVDHQKFQNYLKLFGNHSVVSSPMKKVEAADYMFNLLLIHNTSLKTYLFNTLLEVYRYNRHQFIPTYFLDLMKAKNCPPNMDTFNTLFGIYCEQGNTAAADKLLDFVKKCNIPLTSSVYAAMITGHSRVGELDQAKALLESLKVKGQAPTTVYCSLLCAYAEKGLVESIKETCMVMKTEGMQLDMRSYEAIMNALSLHGHGSMVADILLLLEDTSHDLAGENKENKYISHDQVGENKESQKISHDQVGENKESQKISHDQVGENKESQKISHDLAGGNKECQVAQTLYYVCYSCLSRKELTAPLLLMRHMSKSRKIDMLLLRYFVWSRFQDGERKSDVIQVLQDCLGEEYRSQIAYAVAMELIMHKFKSSSSIGPCLNELKPHPWGDSWITEARSALTLLWGQGTSRDSVSNLDLCAPLLARHCSDADISGLVETYYLLVCNNQHHSPIIKHLVYQALSNAGVDLDTWIKAEMEKEPDRTLLAQLLTFQYSFSKVSSIIKSVRAVGDKVEHKFDGVFFNDDLLMKDEQTLQEMIDIAVDLLQCGVPLYSFRKRFAVHLLYWNTLYQKLDSATFQELVMDRLPFIWPESKMDNNHVCVDVKDMNSDITASDWKELFMEMVRQKHLVNNRNLPEAIYKSLPKSEQEDFIIRCFKVALSANRKKKTKALRGFEELRSLNRDKEIPRLIWMRMVCQGYLCSVAQGDALLEKLESLNFKPDRSVFAKMLAAFTTEDIKRAEETYEILKEVDPIVNNRHIGILPLWGKLGEYEKINGMQQSLRKTGGGAFKLNSMILQSKVLALIVRNEICQAMEVASDIKMIFEPRLACHMVEKLISEGHSMQEWKTMMCDRGLSEQWLNTFMFFSYVKNGFPLHAKQLVQQIDAFHQPELRRNIKHKREEIVELLKECDVPHLLQEYLESEQMMSFKAKDEELSQ